ncbi:MAG: methyl-accepting chemotaxis protein [Acidaminococcales bacterium]|nr:methyl-accepting chemotaxis protein [Acidaminococcales bacterium]
MKSIKGKLLCAVISLFVISIALIVTFTTMQLTRSMRQRIREDVIFSGNGIEKVLVSHRNSVLSTAKVLASLNGLPEAIAAGDGAKARSLLTALSKETDVDVIIVVNKQGTVVARTHDAKAGDNIAGRPEVRGALAGQSGTLMESTELTKFSIRAAVPVYSGSAIVGMLLCGMDALKPSFVDTVKDLYGSDCTIFIGETRESTTIMQDGKRAIGTKADPHIVEQVLGKGQVYIGEAEILGKPFMTIYKPIKIEKSDKPIGMYFSGISLAEVNDSRNETILTNVAIAAVTFLVCIAAIVLIVKKITKPIPLIAQVVEVMSKGDLRNKMEIKSSDELGVLARQFSHMEQILREMLGNIINSANTLAASARQLSGHAESSSSSIGQISELASKMTEGAAKQVSEITLTKKTLDYMSERMEQTSSNAQQVADFTQNAVAAAETGRHAITQAVVQMQTIVADTDKVQTAVSNLSESSSQINQIIEVISAIAGQTNLLALNAAIEAARAGEQGRGFAVVAEEVRKLAEESEKAAISIKNLLQVNQSNINMAVEAMQRNSSGVKDGIEVVTAAGASFNDIVSAIAEVTGKIGSIVTEVKDLSQESETISATADNVYAISKKAAEQAENVLSVIEEQTAVNHEMASASHDLADIANGLNEQMSYFKIS